MFDDPSQLDRVLRVRHDLLKPNAYGLFLNVPEESHAWTVVFEYSDSTKALMTRIEGRPRKDSVGSAVRVDLDAERPWAVKVHSDIRLGAVRRLPSTEQVSALCGAMEVTS
jgi:hypothetical protein